MTKIIELNVDLINAIDLSAGFKYIEWNKKNFDFFDEKAGKEPYKLITYLTTFIDKNIPLIDIGTYYGFSATSLSLSGHKVITYDVCDWIPDESDDITIKNNSNITIKIMNCINDIENICKSDFIILDIDPHNGIEERIIIDELINNGFKGILLLDDINLNDEMKTFWNEIELEKIDATSVGHWSGTGLVIFSDKYTIVI